MSDERCWVVRRADEDEYEGERHYLTEREARDKVRSLAERDESATAEQLPEPCITLTCRGCDYVVDEDDEGAIHFESPKQAREYVTGSFGEGVLFEGDVLMRCGVDCPGHERDGAEPSEPAEQSAYGLDLARAVRENRGRS